MARQAFAGPDTRPRTLAQDLVDLASGNPDPALLPPIGPALRLVSQQSVLYNDPPELRALVAFAKAEFAADGIPADSVAVTSGALDAIDRILREYLRPGDRVAVEDPCYPALLDLLAASGLVVEPIALDAEGPQPDRLAAALRTRPGALIVTPRAQNPTGAAISQTRARELSELLKPHDEVLVIENDPLAPIAGVPAVTMTEGRRQWAVVRSTSKFLGPDLRVAVLTGDERTLARVRGRQAVGPRWVSRVLQHLALALWSDPSSGRHLARVGSIYAARRDALRAALAARDIHLGTASGFNVWIPVRHEAATVQQLAGCGWAVAAGEHFRVRSGPGIRVTTSVLEEADAQRLAGDLASALGAAHQVPA
jgi:DNA-binding transcriptional MocR family regulator